ncbi:adenylate/guanylate cyclase domain-containing protein [Tomitella cavernea]|uniref:adenylate/guanylate cyclase domain-containing protein n=1 Tax=Tomitella cavernea TaxID=1387982 RepID=UPI0027DB78F1|nr:adenylate/guanylate cyclase domain-containing protein [Tomitella cavernea]
MARQRGPSRSGEASGPPGPTGGTPRPGAAPDPDDAPAPVDAAPAVPAYTASAGSDRARTRTREADRARARAAESLAPPSVVDATRKAIEVSLLGGERKYDRYEIAELADVPVERCTELWTAMGFAIPSDPDAANYTDSDVAALRVLKRLTDSGVLRPDVIAPISRATGQAMSRLAEWQVSLVTDFVLHALMDNRRYPGKWPGGSASDAAHTPGTDAGDEPFDEETVTSIVVQTADALLPMIRDLQNHVWRRHLAATSERILLRTREGDDSRPFAVGFADMVGYTHLTRRIDITDLATLLDEFESICARVIAEHHGRIIKNVGDEVMFTADDADTAALIGIALQDAIGEAETLPKIRVGMAYGDVLVRYGDAYGAVVNIAARLTGAARPGTVLVDESLAQQLTPPNGLSTRMIRPVKVHGYSRLRARQLRKKTRWVRSDGERPARGGRSDDESAE